MSNRVEKVNSLLKRYVSEIIANKINDPRVSGSLVSVSSVSTTPDLKYAKISLSIFSTIDKTQILQALQSASGFIRKELASKVEFRCVPSLNFELDNSAEFSQKINSILKTISSKDEDNK